MGKSLQVLKLLFSQRRLERTTWVAMSALLCKMATLMWSLSDSSFDPFAFSVQDTRVSHFVIISRRINVFIVTIHTCPFLQEALGSVRLQVQVFKPFCGLSSVSFLADQALGSRQR